MACDGSVAFLYEFETSARKVEQLQEDEQQQKMVDNVRQVAVRKQHLQLQLATKAGKQVRDAFNDEIKKRQCIADLENTGVGQNVKWGATESD